MKNVLSALLFLLSICVSDIYSQQLDDVVPLDPEVVYGKLENGLTYYIRHNEKPEKRAEFFLVVNAGSILEDDDQDGLAHFCEHMAFNGTKNFEKHEIIDYLQSIGMKFGPEINAFTTHDATNYMLQKVPIDVPENIDTALLVLYEWACNVSYEDEEIDNERGVIHEEWRTRRGAEFRMMTQFDKDLYKGSKYAERDVIGEIDIIDKAPYKAFRRFYNDWYRPDLQAVIAVGDFDVEQMKNKIIQQFSQIPVHENPRKREYFPIPDHDQAVISIQKDAEARFCRVRIKYFHEPKEDKNTYKQLRSSLKDELYGTMINARFAEYSRTANPPFTYAYAYYSNEKRTKDSYNCIAMSKNNDIERTLSILLQENKRIKEYGFTQTEIERAKIDILDRYEDAYKERSKNESGKYTWSYFSHFLSKEPAPGIELLYSYAKKEIPDISLEELNQLGKSYMPDKNMSIIITGPDQKDIYIPDKEVITTLLDSVNKCAVGPYVDDVKNEPLLAEIPKPGKVISEEPDPVSGFTKWKLENGAEVYIKQTDFREDEILFAAMSFGGSSLYPIEDNITAKVATRIAGECGIGDFSNNELQKYMTGKIAYVRPYISETVESINGATRQADLETFLQLLYLTFTKPRFDETGYSSFLEKQKSWFENKSLDPAYAFYDTITSVLSDYNPFRKPMSMESFEEVDFDRARTIYSERFSNAGNFKFYFVGNIDPEKSKNLLETYIGGLPATESSESYNDLNIRYPGGIIEKEVSKEMEVPKGTVRIIFTGDFEYNLRNRILLQAVNNILDIRFTEVIREEQGGTYGVSVFSSQTKIPNESYNINIQFDCDPENIEKLTKIAFEEIEKLKSQGPLKKDLDAFITNKKKEREEELKENKFWLNYMKQNFITNKTANPADYLEIVTKLKAIDIQKAAKDYIGDNQIKVVLLPTKKK